MWFSGRNRTLDPGTGNGECEFLNIAKKKKNKALKGG